MAEYAPTRYVATSGQTNFAIPWTYNLAKPQTVVMLKNGVELVQGIDYNLSQYYTAVLTVGADAGDYIVLLRRSDFERNPTDWTDEGRLTEAAHDAQDNELLRRDQELKAAGGLPRANDRDAWTAKDENGNPLRVGDVEDPDEDTDAANKRWVNSRIDGTIPADAGVYRVVYTGPGTGGGLINEVDGTNNRFQIITDGKAVLSTKSIILAWWDERLVTIDDLELHANGLDVLFDNPPPCGTRVEIFVVVGVSALIEPGTLTPAMLQLATGLVITGDGSNRGSAVARSAILLSELGAPTANVSMNSKKITALAAGAAGTDAVNKTQMDAAIAAIADPFALVEYNNAVVYSTTTKVTNAIQNTKSRTQAITLNFYDVSGAASEWNIYIGDDSAVSVNRKFATHWRVTGTAGNDDRSITFFVPAGKYWRAEQVTTNGAAFTFTYQRGGPA